MSPVSSPFMLAWRLLADRPAATVRAWLAMGAAVALVFVQFGVFFGIADGATALARSLRCDFVVLDLTRERLAGGAMFPTRLLRLMRAVPGVEAVAPLGTEPANWWGVQSAGRLRVTLLGIEPADLRLLVRATEAEATALRLAGNVVVDRRSRSGMGTLPLGATAWLDGNAVRVAGRVDIGADVLREGTVIAGMSTFAQITGATSDQADAGLIRIEPGANRAQVRARLREIAGPRLLVLTPGEQAWREFRVMLLRSTTGIVFGFVVLAAAVVGVLVCYQLLFGFIHRLGPQWALLRSLGWPQSRVDRTVFALALIVGAGGFAAGLAASEAVYRLLEARVQLGVGLTLGRTAAVAAVEVAVITIAVRLALGRVRRDDPAELF